MSKTKATLNCSCGMPLGDWVGADGTIVAFCPHCDELCNTPRDECSRCVALSKADNHNTSFTPPGKLPKVVNNGEGMPNMDPPKAIEPPKPKDDPPANPPPSEA